MALGASALDTYLLCAANCAQSFADFGERFTLITNAPTRLQQRYRALGAKPPEIRGAEFGRRVPQNLGFESAHRKLEVIQLFARGEYGERPALVDIDTELVRPLPESVADSDAFLAYEISKQVFGDALDRPYRAALAEVARGPSPARWWGGEFLLGSAEQFARLNAHIEPLWDHYLAVADGLEHQGDEVLLSVALNTWIAEGGKVHDAGGEGVIARWWSARTQTPMPALSDVSGASILHLPADKEFLSRRATHRTDSSAFLRTYQRAIRGKVMLRRTAALIDRLLRRSPKRYSPRL